MVEDLWSLSLEMLNEIAKGLNKQLKASEEEDFLKVAKPENTRIKLAFDIAIHILNTKKAEADTRDNERAIKAQRNKLLELKAKKQDEGLEGMSVEEIDAELAKLS